MSTKYLTLMSLMRRPNGVDQREACEMLSVSPSTYRGMVRDFKELFTVRTQLVVTDKRRARHFIGSGELDGQEGA